MRRLGLTLLSTSALATLAASMAPALAADLIKKSAAPAAVAAPVYNWTGFYLGGNLGYSWGRAKVNGDIAGFTVDSGPPVGFVDVPGGSINDKVNLDGWIGGGQIGYNWQTAPNWLWGLEADIQGSGEKGSGRSRSDFDINLGDGEGVFGSTNTRYDAKISWFGTARIRGGFITDNNLLFYATGGLAYGNVKLSGKTSTDVNVLDCPDGCSIVFSDTFGGSFSESKTKAGWTLGAGIEGFLWDPRWTWRVEYLYIDLGSLHVRESGGNLDAKFTDNIVRFGLNFRP